MIFEVSLYVGLIGLSIAMILFLIRALVGPTISDRILALDALGITLVGFVGLIIMQQDTNAYADVLLVLAILAFVGTVALSKFIERGAVIDRD